MNFEISSLTLIPESVNRREGGVDHQFTTFEEEARNKNIFPTFQSKKENVLAMF